MLFGAFEECTINPDCLESNNFSGDWTEEFIKIAGDNINPPFVSIDGYLELTCPTSNGIIPIKEALTLATNIEKEDNCHINIQYVSAPKYRIQVKAMDYKVAEDLLRSAAELAIDHIKKNNGNGTFHRKES